MCNYVVFVSLIFSFLNSSCWANFFIGLYKNISSSFENLLAQAVRCTACQRNDGSDVRARTLVESICPLANGQVRNGFLGAAKTETAFRMPLKILVVLPTPPPYRHETSIIGAHYSSFGKLELEIYLFIFSINKRQFSTRWQVNDYGFFCIKNPRLIRLTSQTESFGRHGTFRVISDYVRIKRMGTGQWNTGRK